MSMHLTTCTYKLWSFYSWQYVVHSNQPFFPLGPGFDSISPPIKSTAAMTNTHTGTRLGRLGPPSRWPRAWCKDMLQWWLWANCPIRARHRDSSIIDLEQNGADENHDNMQNNVIIPTTWKASRKGTIAYLHVRSSLHCLHAHTHVLYIVISLILVPKFSFTNNSYNFNFAWGGTVWNITSDPKILCVHAYEKSDTVSCAVMYSQTSTHLHVSETTSPSQYMRWALHCSMRIGLMC